MKKLDETKGRLAFFSLLLLVMVMAFIAYLLSGNMGIEERFTHAVGRENGGEGGGGGGWSEITLEGSPQLYALVLGALGAACYAGYRHFRI